ncbi:MAG: HAMP domain-containing protein [Planctomycetes bacterium]|nr:HAMP domain-containing protein [Planctomycetota bacterium]
MGKASATRFTVILTDGRVIGDSEKPSDEMDNHSDRPEIRQAMLGKIGSEIRRSDTLQMDMMYLAIPHQVAEKELIVIRAAIPVVALAQALNIIYSKFALGGIIIALLAAVVCFFISRWISRPVEELKQGVIAFSKGELKNKIPIPDSEEIGALAEAINLMAEELDQRIKALAEQRNEQEAIFASMVEGVLAVDLNENILWMNRAAEKILELKSEEVKGRFVQEVIRNPDLQAFIRRSLSEEGVIEGDIALRENGDRFFQACSDKLRNAAGKSIGIVIVLNEVTRLYKLERVRRDFVANVSHELRTPITSIRGFAETLLEKGKQSPEEADKFITIIFKQVKRLNAIIEDLLALSRLEKQTDDHEVKLVEAKVKSVLLTARQLCELLATEKNIELKVDCPDGLQGRLSVDLLERAVANLIDNAIKYSENDSQILIEGVNEEKEIHINVKDQGCGIAKEHQSRIFERFYRVDKARSRKQGGTGLGLAIVKHTAQLHGGSVRVESTPGKGSIFTIILPKPEF